MRIGDKDSSFPGQPGPNRDRAKSFRRDRRPGEQVRGRFLRPAGPGLAWVDIEGHHLVARVSGDLSPDEVLTFEILELQPEVVLRHLVRTDGRLDRKV